MTIDSHKPNFVKAKFRRQNPLNQKFHMALAESTRKVYESVRNAVPSPRMKQALRLYASAAVPSKKAAARVVGLSPSALYTRTMKTVQNKYAPAIMDEVDRAIANRHIELSATIAVLGREAVAKLRQLMHEAKDEVAVRAAIDLADRSPETAKRTQVDVSTFSLTGKDVKELAAALVESARGREEFAAVARDGLEEVIVEQVLPTSIIVARRKAETEPDGVPDDEPETVEEPDNGNQGESSGGPEVSEEDGDPGKGSE